MRRSLSLGSAFGIPLKVHWTFILLPLWALFLHWNEGTIGILFALAVLLSMFGCVLLHELGHALMARWFGIGTRDITLYPIGGVARLESTGNRPHEEICIALAGPAVNLAIVLLLTPLVSLPALTATLQAGAAAPAGLLAAYVSVLWAGNLVLCLFNLVPAFPMDGGRVLRGVLSLGMSRLEATSIAATVGLFAALTLAFIGLLVVNPSLVLVSLFVAWMGQRELAALREQEEAQARFAPDVPVVVPVRTPATAVLVWDDQRRVWVRWVDGQRMDVCWASPWIPSPWGRVRADT